MHKESQETNTAVTIYGNSNACHTMALQGGTTYTQMQVHSGVISTSHTFSLPSSGEAQKDDTPKNEDDALKESIYNHPLFPLLSVFFEKCEEASQTSNCPTSDSLAVSIQNFLQQKEKEKMSFVTDNSELDLLMVNAIQVLRIHLAELEKVSDLCKDFCQRYIACLKSKLQSEQLLRIDNEFDDSFEEKTSVSQPQQQGLQHVIAPGLLSPANNLMTLQSGIAQPAMATLNQGQLVSGGTVYQMVQTPQGLVAQPIQIQTAVQPTISCSPIIHGSTRLSQIGVTSSPVTMATTSGPTIQPAASNILLSDSDEEDAMGKKKSKRGVLPKSATSVMKSWLFQHIVHPYPTEDEKRQIASQTNLTLLQVNNWFINARRRILQPMLDASNPEPVKSKKPKHQQRPVPQRFWPESIANIQPQLPVASDEDKTKDKETSDSSSSKTDKENEETSSALEKKTKDISTPAKKSASKNS